MASIDDEDELRATRILNGVDKEDEEKKAIERLDYFEPDDLVECVMYRDCVETIKNLIEKQQKEIEELKKYEKYYEEMEEVNKKFIAEDKIKAKIEEYDDKGMTVNLANRSAGKTFQQAVHYEVKKVLQSLLEKE